MQSHYTNFPKRSLNELILAKHETAHKNISDYRAIMKRKLRRNQVVMIQKQVSFGSGPLAFNGTPP